jgi:hypothetical protein
MASDTTVTAACAKIKTFWILLPVRDSEVRELLSRSAAPTLACVKNQPGKIEQATVANAAAPAANQKL